MIDEQDPPEEIGSGDYEVGYKKPPKHTRFQPGRSGNPRGRPKGARNLKSDLEEELRERVVIREGEQSRRISKQRAVVKALVANTLKGDARAANLLMSTMMRLLDTGEGTPEVAESIPDDELEILRNYEERLRRGSAAPTPTRDGREDAPEEPS